MRVGLLAGSMPPNATWIYKRNLQVIDNTSYLLFTKTQKFMQIQHLTKDESTRLEITQTQTIIADEKNLHQIIDKLQNG